MKRQVIRALAIAGVSLSLLTPSYAAEKVTVALNWFPAGEHVGLWVALDKGYFKERNLDVTLEHSKGSGDSMIKIDTGRADIALSDAGVLVAGRARGANVKVIGVLFDQTPLNFFSRKDNPIRTPKDVIGKSIAAAPSDSQRQLWPAFAGTHGIDPNSVTWVNVEPTAKVGALAQKRVDAAAHTVTATPYYEKVIGADNLVTMTWAQFNFDMYSLAFAATQDTLSKRPEVVKAFLEAAYLGWRDVMQDPEAAMQIYKKHVPEIDVPGLTGNLKIGLSLMKTDTFIKNGIGAIDDKRMCKTVELVKTYMDVKGSVECADVYTKDLFTKVAPPAGWTN